MTTDQIREAFLAFFMARGHQVLSASSLLSADDPSVLFTTAGMQQFKPYYLDARQAPAPNIVTIQPCLRTSDIEAVGDDTHLTYFDMLGNFSFGNYYKQETVAWWVEFLASIGIEQERLVASVFAGDSVVPKDTESIKALEQAGFNAEQIRQGPRADNFWGPTGTEGPCGPCIELYIDEVEIGTLVFNEYYSDKDQVLTPLTNKGVDVGIGLERLAVFIQQVADVYETDELAALMTLIPEGELRSRRIIADHVRAIDALVVAGLEPSNKDRGYVLRRLIRRAVTHGHLINKKHSFISTLVEVKVKHVVESEIEKFYPILTTAEALFFKNKKAIELHQKESGGYLSPKVAFDLHQSHGVPFEVLQELAEREGLIFSQDLMETFIKEHQEKSKIGLEKKFKGGLVEVTDQTTRLHTAHHLLLAALRQVLGDHVVQRGSNITDERLRIDFVHPQAVTKEELEKVEAIVNEKIGEDLLVTKEEMKLEKAYQAGALGEFGAKYPETVTVYSIGPRPSSAKATQQDRPFSIEICGGPHVERTGSIGKFKISKEEASSSGIRRIRAVVE